MVKLKRNIGLLEVTVYGIGIILGAGIYVLIGEAAGLTGNSLWMSFILGAVIASFTGLSYCELSTMFPKAAAEYNYTKKSFNNNLIPFIIGWLFIFIGILTSAAVALGFAGYFKAIFNIPIIFGAVGLILFLSFVSYYGIKESVRFNIILTFIEILGLIIIIFIGIRSWGSVNYFEFPFGAKGLFASTALIFFAYIGFESIANIAEEVKNPKKIIPKAIILSVLITTILYILVAISTISVVGWEELSQSEAPLSLVASKVFGEKAFFILSIIALFSTTNTVLITMITTARMMYGMSHDHSLPRILGSVHHKRRTPWASIVLVMLLSLLFILIGSIDFVANTTSLGALIIFAFINTSLIILRFTKPNHERKFKVPLNIGKFPIIPFLGVLSCLFLIFQFQFDVFVVMIGIVIAGIILFALKEFMKHYYIEKK